MGKFAVQVPIKGYVIAVVEATCLEGAIALVKDGMDLNPEEEDDADPGYLGSCKVSGICNKEAAAPDENALAIIRQAFEVDN